MVEAPQTAVVQITVATPTRWLTQERGAAPWHSSRGRLSSVFSPSLLTASRGGVRGHFVTPRASFKTPPDFYKSRKVGETGNMPTSLDGGGSCLSPRYDSISQDTLRPQEALESGGRARGVGSGLQLEL